MSSARAASDLTPSSRPPLDPKQSTKHTKPWYPLDPDQSTKHAESWLQLVVQICSSAVGKLGSSLNVFRFIG
ncbi:hypothetical protein T484DRAFT_1976568 [Baffinella frigidus]|nr:hypothetical protein T484DRAFT_1976568 [Cryptophyta sp. CCMP2293]